MRKTILISGASSGIGQLTAFSLARSGHRVYASMRDIEGRNKFKSQKMIEVAIEESLDLRTIELDVSRESSIKKAIDLIHIESSEIDVLIHNAGHMTFGPTEAFSAQQLAAMYDVNVLGAHRINQQALPKMRQRQDGLILWISSSSARGGTPPLLGPYFAAKAAMDSLAISYATELSKWGIETSIIVPGAFISGTNHFENAGSPSNQACALEYIDGPYKGIDLKIFEGLKRKTPANADPSMIAEKVAEVVELKKGQRPFRLHIDPCDDGCEVVNTVADRIRQTFLKEIDLEDLLHVTPLKPGASV